MSDNWSEQVERFCGNCGLVKIECPRCGMKSVMKKISRRHVRVDEHAPPNQSLK